VSPEIGLDFVKKSLSYSLSGFVFRSSSPLPVTISTELSQFLLRKVTNARNCTTEDGPLRVETCWVVENIRVYCHVSECD
jgi:hypothetical protein